MSEKFLPYLGIAYVASHQGIASILATALGSATCSLYFLMPPGLRKVVGNVLLPDFVVNAGPWELLGGLFFSDPPPRVYAPLMRNLVQPGNAPGSGNGTNAAMRQVGRTAPAPRPAPLPPPSQEAIDQLTAMGFEEDRVKEALQQSGNSIERAADRLLSG